MTEFFSINTTLSVRNCTLSTINSFASMRSHELLRNSVIKSAEKKEKRKEENVKLLNESADNRGSFNIKH